MNNDELLKVSSAADMIVCGYAFSKAEDSNIRVLDLKEPHHAILMSAQGEVLDTSEVEPMSHIFQDENVFREDVVTNGDNKEAMLANAPKAKEGQYQVPKTIG